MWLLIDDIRDLNCDKTARTADEGKVALRAGGFTHLCLDHDLGEASVETGYDVLVWALHYGLVPENVQLVTSNPVGRSNMRFQLENAGWSTTDGVNFNRTE